MSGDLRRGRLECLSLCFFGLQCKRELDVRILRCLAVAGCLLLASLARADDAALVEASLDEFHESAARADTAAYFGVMTEDVVFLGTDASERWQGQAFRDFVTSHFSAGRVGPMSRYSAISLSPLTAIPPGSMSCWKMKGLVPAAAVAYS